MMAVNVKNPEKPGLLMTANWDSGVGYAWWLMESYWAVLASAYNDPYDCILAYPSISTIPENLTQAPIAVVEEDFSAFGVKFLRQIRFIVKHRVRVIYFSDKPAMHWAYILFRLFGVRKIVVHDHTPGVRTPPGMVKKFVKKALLSIPGIKADVCIGATEFVRKRFIDVACMPENRCFAVPNGVSTKLPERESIHKRFGIPRDRPVIVTAARANRYKGGFFALDVFSMLSKNGCDQWHYVYMGDGPDREALIQKSNDLGLDDRVSFPGRVNGVTSLFQSCLLAFHPSKGEVGYSLSILEYMLCGLPVVVPDNPSVCGATNTRVNGYVYHEGDVQDAAATILCLLEDPLKTNEMGEVARKDVCERFSLEQAHRKLIEVFEEAVYSAR